MRCVFRVVTSVVIVATFLAVLPLQPQLQGQLQGQLQDELESELQSEQQAESTNTIFRKAIAAAQAKTVKVYGATAGRVDGYASGVIISADGKIITMQGVFLEGQNVRVTLPDGVTHPATVLKRDRILQIALLKIEQKTPDYFNISDKQVGEKGDWVVTLSNAFKVADGVEPLSVNLGVISLRTAMRAELNDRDVAYDGPMVLIDAITSNPGAAGGAVVSIEGALVGVIGKVINSSETNTRLNYAVPAEVIFDFVSGKQRTPTAVAASQGKPGDLGVRLFKLGGRRSPAYIDRVVAKSPAAKAGLRADDLVIRLSGEKVATVADFSKLMQNVKAGDEVIILVTRGNKVIRVPLVAIEK